MVLKFKKAIYPLSAILHTANLYSDKVYFKIDERGKEILVNASLKQGSNNSKLKKLMEEFQNELINQTLRLKIAKENKKIRETIIYQALCSSVPQPQEIRAPTPPEAEIKEEEIDKELEEILKEIEEEDYKDDPLGIAIPWEEKYGKKQKDS